MVLFSKSFPIKNRSTTSKFFPSKKMLEKTVIVVGVYSILVKEILETPKAIKNPKTVKVKLKLFEPYNIIISVSTNVCH